MPGTRCSSIGIEFGFGNGRNGAVPAASLRASCCWARLNLLSSPELLRGTVLEDAETDFAGEEAAKYVAVHALAPTTTTTARANDRRGRLQSLTEAYISIAYVKPTLVFAKCPTAVESSFQAWPLLRQ